MGSVWLVHWHRGVLGRRIQRFIVHLSKHYVTVNLAGQDLRFRLKDGFQRGVYKGDHERVECFKIDDEELPRLRAMVAPKAQA